MTDTHHRPVAAQLLDRFIQLHNEATRTGDQTRVRALLTVDAEVCIEGACISGLRSRAIARAFRDHAVMLWRISTIADSAAYASYAWQLRPAVGGVVRVDVQEGRIARLTLRPGYSRLFAALTRPNPFELRNQAA